MNDGRSGQADEMGPPDRGRRAQRPSEIPAEGWKDIAWRIRREIAEDRVALVSAGVSFYLLLALFPAMTAFVSTYGMFADPSSIARQVTALATVLPDDALTIIADRLESLANQEQGQLSVGFSAGLLFAFWSANNGVKSLFEALNVAYEEDEKRSFLRLNVIAFGFTLGAMATAVVLIAAVGLIPIIIELLNLGMIAGLLVAIGRWLLFVVLIAGGISLLYSYGPSRRRARWQWITRGSAFATVAWLATSVAFSWYLQNFGNYEAVYGSLGAVIGLMVWTWLSVMILILGAEVNAETEHQTARDSTIGTDKPIGQRGAVVADTVGRNRP